MWDLWLIAGIGFLGSFGHCVGMCGPIAVTLSLAKQTAQQPQSSSSPPSHSSANGSNGATVPNDCCSQDATTPPVSSAPLALAFSWSQLRFH
ncbi:MAG: sulfite exporter TauE/SafE family protein, partial [Symploca sp. SIO2B6]|nr:sulfite exporter TauE/SafE family protein [Symploca sp. SIO2B6]